MCKTKIILTATAAELGTDGIFWICMSTQPVSSNFTERVVHSTQYHFDGWEILKSGSQKFTTLCREKNDSYGAHHECRKVVYKSRGLCAIFGAASIQVQFLFLRATYMHFCESVKPVKVVCTVQRYRIPAWGVWASDAHCKLLKYK